MKKKDIFNAILTGAALFIPGGAQVKKGIEIIIDRNEDPDDDVEELSGAISDVVIGSVKAAEGLSGKDLVNDPVLKVLDAKVKSDIAWYIDQVGKVRVPKQDATGTPV